MGARMVVAAEALPCVTPESLVSVFSPRRAGGREGGNVPRLDNAAATCPASRPRAPAQAVVGGWVVLGGQRLRRSCDPEWVARTWADDWDERRAGQGCPKCAEGRPDEDQWGVQVLRRAVG